MVFGVKSNLLIMLCSHHFSIQLSWCFFSANLMACQLMAYWRIWIGNCKVAGCRHVLLSCCFQNNSLCRSRKCTMLVGTIHYSGLRVAVIFILNTFYFRATIFYFFMNPLVYLQKNFWQFNIQCQGHLHFVMIICFCQTSLQVSRAHSLRHLNIGGTFITDESLYAVANSCANLKVCFSF